MEGPRFQGILLGHGGHAQNGRPTGRHTTARESHRLIGNKDHHFDTDLLVPGLRAPGCDARIFSCIGTKDSCDARLERSSTASPIGISEATYIVRGERLRRTDMLV